MTNRSPLSEALRVLGNMAILLLTVTISMYLTMWHIGPWVLEHWGLPGLLLGAITAVCLGAVSWGKRIQAEIMVTKQAKCDHVFIGDVCKNCNYCYND